MSSTFFTVSSPQGVSIYATASLFPPTGYLGQLAEDASAQNLYSWNGSAWEIIASHSGFAGVTSLNALTGALTLVDGTNITVTPSGSSITIATPATINLDGIQQTGQSTTLIDLTTQRLYDANGAPSVYWNTRKMFSAQGQTIDYQNDYLMDDGNGQVSIDWFDRLINAKDGTTLINYHDALRFVNADEGTAGYVWTSTDTQGSGHWAPSVAPTGQVTGIAFFDGSGNLSSDNSIFVINGRVVTLLSPDSNTRIALDTSTNGAPSLYIGGNSASDTAYIGSRPFGSSSSAIIYGSADISGSGTSGNVTLKTGTTVGGTVGHLKLAVGPQAFQWPETAGTAGQALVTDGNSPTAGLSWATVSSSGANTTLSNLTSPTALNHDLIFATGSAATLQTQDSASATAQDLTIRGGNVTGGSGNGGNLILKAGTSFGGTAGNILLQPPNGNGSAGNVVTQAIGSTGKMQWSTVSQMLDTGINNVQGDILYRDASGWSALAPGTSGQVLQTQGANANPTWANTGAPITKVTKTYTDFSTAGTANSITLFSLPAGTILEQVIIKHSAAFTGGSISAYTISVGISGNNNKYASAFDVFQAPGSTVFQLSTSSNIEDFSSPTNITVRAKSTGANLNAATAGSVDIYCITKALI